MALEEMVEIEGDANVSEDSYGVSDAELFEGGETLEAEADVPDADEIETDDTIEAADVDDDAPDEDEADPDDEAKADDDEAETKDKTDDEPETIFTLKVRGEEIEVSQSELIKGWQDNAANTQKAQAHADEVREFNAYREQETNTLRELLAYNALPTANEPRPEEFVGKPAEFMEAYGNWQKESQRQSLAENTLKAIESEETQRVLSHEAGLLQEKIPEWSDESVRQADFVKMTELASKTYGFSPEDIAQTTDHRLLVVLRDLTRLAAYESSPVVLKRVTNTKQGLSGGTKTAQNGTDTAHAKAVRKINSGAKLSGVDLADAFFQ